jgi:hypothetical protein
MIPVEAHLSLNHVPMVGLLFGLVFLLIGVRRDSVPAIRAALQTFVAVGFIAAAAGTSGLVAADMLSSAPWFDASVVGAHQVAGITTVSVLIALASYALFVLFSLRETPEISRGVTMALLGLALAGLGAALWTAYLGGRIRHSELSGIVRGNLEVRCRTIFNGEGVGDVVSTRASWPAAGSTCRTRRDCSRLCAVTGPKGVRASAELAGPERTMAAPAICAA